MDTILVTGGAGFIGYHLSKRLLKDGYNVVGYDNMNDYYDPKLKEDRVRDLEESGQDYRFIKGDLADKDMVFHLFEEIKPAIVINLAAQAGVRYSIDHPDSYIQSNIVGFFNILEACRHYPVKHLLFASSSSIYGNQEKVPFSVNDPTDPPNQPFMRQRKSLTSLWHILYPTISGFLLPGFVSLRFTDRPADQIWHTLDSQTNCLQETRFRVFNYGNCKRDFTYVDDIVEGVKRVMQCAPEKINGEDGLPIPPYRVYNIGNNSPENLLDFVDILQQELIRAGVLPEDYDFEAHKKLVPMQPGDVPVTYADTSALERDFGFKPSTSLREGLRRFAEWYKEFYL